MAGQNYGKAVVRVEADRSRLAAGLAAAQKQLQSFASGAMKIGKAGLVAGASASTGLLAPAMLAVKHFADVGSELDDMSQRTGASVEALSGLGYAAKMSGAELGDIEKGLRTMQKGLVAGDEGFAKLGLSTEQLLKMKPEQQMAVIADKIAKLPTPAERAAASFDIFGKAGASLLPMLQGGSDGINSLIGEAKSLGVVMSGEDAQAAATLGDSMDRLTTAGGSLTNTIGAALAPAFTAVLAVITFGVVTLRDWIAANQGVVIAIAAVAAGLGLAGAALVVAAGAAFGLSVAMGALGAATTAAGSIMSFFASILSGGVAAAPALVVAGLVALTAYLIYASGAGGKALTWLSDKFTMLQEIAGPVFKGIQDAMSGGDFGLAANILWEGLQLAWLKGTADIQKVFRDSLNAMLGTLDGWMAQFRSRWNDVSGWLADRFLDLQGTFDSTFDSEAAKKIRAEDTARQNKGFARGVTERAAARDANAQTAEQATRDRIAALEGQLAESLKRAADTAENAAEKNKQAGQLQIDEFDARLGEAQKKQDEGLAEKKKTDPKVLGTSSGFAAAFLQGGGSIDKQILDENKEQTKQLVEIGKALAPFARLALPGFAAAEQALKFG